LIADLSLLCAVSFSDPGIIPRAEKFKEEEVRRKGIVRP
jgi:hypothetical protein